MRTITIALLLASVIPRCQTFGKLSNLSSSFASLRAATSAGDGIVTQRALKQAATTAADSSECTQPRSEGRVIRVFCGSTDAISDLNMNTAAYPAGNADAAAANAAFAAAAATTSTAGTDDTDSVDAVTPTAILPAQKQGCTTRHQRADANCHNMTSVGDAVDGFLPAGFPFSSSAAAAAAAADAASAAATAAGAASAAAAASGVNQAAATVHFLRVQCHCST